MAMAVVRLATLDAGAQMLFFGHRGESRDAPENTLAAFNLALSRGDDGFECDIYLSRDKHIVCIHDPTTSRTTGNVANLNVTNSTLAELRALDVGSWKSPAYAGEKIPTIEEILSLAQDGRTILIEIKQAASSGIVPFIKSAIDAEPKATPQRIVFISFDTTSVFAIRAALPDYEAYWLSYYSSYANNVSGLVDLLKSMNASGFDGRYDENSITNGMVESLHQAGFSTHVWTVDGANQALTCYNTGVKSLTSNCARDMMDNVYGAQVSSAWLDNYPGLLSAHTNNYLATAMAKTRKYDETGREMTVWEDFAAGTCPTNAASRFRVLFEQGVRGAILHWEPDLASERRYTIWGKSDLRDVAWITPTNNNSRFYRVSVSLP